MLDDPGAIDMVELFERVKTLMLAGFVYGSDPGLCVASEEAARRLTVFGKRAQSEVLNQVEARAAAESNHVLLAGLGGSQEGVIGALAAVGLAASGNDGRYLLVGHSRDLSGLQEVATILSAGISAVQTLDGEQVRQGLVQSEKLRPARRSELPVLYVEWQDDHWQPLKLN
jgi:hypothetical protein